MRVTAPELAELAHSSPRTDVVVALGRIPFTVGSAVYAPCNPRSPNSSLNAVGR